MFFEVFLTVKFVLMACWVWNYVEFYVVLESILGENPRIILKLD